MLAKNRISYPFLHWSLFCFIWFCIFVFISFLLWFLDLFCCFRSAFLCSSLFFCLFLFFVGNGVGVCVLFRFDIKINFTILICTYESPLFTFLFGCIRSRIHTHTSTYTHNWGANPRANHCIGNSIDTDTYWKALKCIKSVASCHFQCWFAFANEVFVCFLAI